MKRIFVATLMNDLVAKTNATDDIHALKTYLSKQFWDMENCLSNCMDLQILICVIQFVTFITTASSIVQNRRNRENERIREEYKKMILHPTNEGWV